MQLIHLKPNASVSIPGGEPGYAPDSCSPALLSELERIANDYIPDNDSQAALALSEMREALQSLLANASVNLSGDEPEYAPRNCSSLLDRIKAEADQFGLCRDRHAVNGNHGAAAVADRAQQRLVEYASELSETND